MPQDETQFGQNQHDAQHNTSMWPQPVALLRRKRGTMMNEGWWGARGYTVSYINNPHDTLSFPYLSELTKRHQGSAWLTVIYYRVTFLTIITVRICCLQSVSKYYLFLSLVVFDLFCSVFSFVRLTYVVFNDDRSLYSVVSCNNRFCQYTAGPMAKIN